MCVGCRERFPQGHLTRIRTAVNKQELIKDGPGRGRSIYICESPNCQQRVLKKDFLTRAMRRPVSEDQVAALREA